MSSPTAQKFTGKERDTESNLDYFGARYYSAGPGGYYNGENPRWISADSVANPSEPKSLNKYQFVLSDPVNYVDLDARFAVCFSSITEADLVLKSFMPSREIPVLRMCLAISPPG